MGDYTVIVDYGATTLRIPIALTAEGGTIHIRAGDFNLDRVINAADIDLLYDTVNQGTNDPFYDLTGDGLVNRDDVDEHVRNILNTEYGDANLDGRVNSSDAAILGGNFGTLSGGTWSMGSFNGDGVVNSSDAAILGGTFGFDNSVSGSSAQLKSIVPSPNVSSAVAAARLHARRLSDSEIETRFTSLVDELLSEDSMAWDFST